MEFSSYMNLNQRLLQSHPINLNLSPTTTIIQRTYQHQATYTNSHRHEYCVVNFTDGNRGETDVLNSSGYFFIFYFFSSTEKLTGIHQSTQ